jgi:beta-phosphoglucomutase-like phosphatase (HAD superfamily)
LQLGIWLRKKKPDPELYLLALRQLSLNPMQCIALEDSNNGLISAKKANIKTICSPSLYHNDDDFGKSDFICEQFTEDKLPIELRQLIFT